MDNTLIAVFLAAALTLVGGFVLPRLVSATRLALFAFGAPLLLSVLVPLSGGVAKEFDLFGLSVSGLLLLFGAALTGAATIAVLRIDR